MSDNIARILFSALCLVSWWTTGTGLFALTDQLIFSYGISACIQGLLAYAVFKFFSVRHIWKSIPLVIYGLTTIVSVLFSISYWFSLFSANEYASTIFDHQYKQVRQEAQVLYNDYAQQNRALESLANKAANIARIEGKQGGTCKGRSKSGEGSLYSKRMYQADQFRSLANRFSAPMKDMKSVLTSIENVRNASIPVREKLIQLDDNLTQIKGTYMSKNSDYKAELRHHLHWEQAGYPAGSIYMSHNFSGSKYACSEISITSPIKSLINSTGKSMPEMNVVVFDPEDQSAVVKKIATALYDFFFAPSKAKKEDQENVFGKQYLLPISMGVLIDTLIFFCAFLLNLGNSREKGITPRSNGKHNIHDLWELYSTSFGIVESAAFSLPKLPGDGKDSIGKAAQYLGTLLNQVTVDIHGSRYFLIPIENDKGQSIKTSSAITRTSFISQIKEVFGVCHLIGSYGKKASGLFKGYGIEEINSCYGFSDGDLDSNCTFDVYRLDDDVMKMIRDYSADTDFSFDEDISWFYTEDNHFDMAKWQTVDSDRRTILCANFVRDKAVSHQNKHGVQEWHLTLHRQDAGKTSLEGLVVSWLRDDDCKLGTPHVIEKNINLGFTSIPYPFLYFFVIDAEGWQTILQYSTVMEDTSLNKTASDDHHGDTSI